MAAYLMVRFLLCLAVCAEAHAAAPQDDTTCDAEGTCGDHLMLLQSQVSVGKTKQSVGKLGKPCCSDGTDADRSTDPPSCADGENPTNYDGECADLASGEYEYSGDEADHADYTDDADYDYMASGSGTLASGTTLTWETANSNAYVCSTSVTSDTVIACAQNLYENGEETTAELTCDSGVISCFVFASGGKVGGSCGGDHFYEDADGWGYMAAETANDCIGQSSCTLTVGDGEVNGYPVDPEATAGEGKFNFKTVAVCQ